MIVQYKDAYTQLVAATQRLKALMDSDEYKRFYASITDESLTDTQREALHMQHGVNGRVFGSFPEAFNSVTDLVKE
jgi:hypothetical protein